MTPANDETILKAPEVVPVALAAVDEVVLAAAEPVLDALAVTIDVAAVVAATAEVAAAEVATTVAPWISLSTVALNVPVMPVRVSLAENAVKGNCGLVGSLYAKLVNLMNHMFPLSPMDGLTV